jgi:hypothetical protein
MAEEPAEGERLMFSDDQKKELGAPLAREVVKTRQQAGRSVSYVEGWHAISEANRIFGFDGWSSETLEINCVAERERLIGEAKRPGFGVTYVARVRVTAGSINHDGYGGGHGIDLDVGQAHESAIKGALIKFGNQFGLALYDKTQSNVADEGEVFENSRQRFIEETKASIERISEHPNKNDLLVWWNSEVERKKRRDFDLLPAEVLTLTSLVKAKAGR